MYMYNNYDVVVLKQNTKINFRSDSLVWNQHNYNNLLTMLNSHYVQMMTIDSPYSPLPLEFNVNKVDLPKTDPTFDQLLNVVVQEIDWGQNHSNTTPLIRLIYYR